MLGQCEGFGGRSETLCSGGHGSEEGCVAAQRRGAIGGTGAARQASERAGERVCQCGSAGERLAVGAHGAVKRDPWWVLLVYALAVALTLILGGCASAKPAGTVNVAIPVACQERTPVAPAWPTNRLKPGVDVYVFTVHAQAEIIMREAYEEQLLAALSACQGSGELP